jgi:hypothetical protein
MRLGLFTLLALMPLAPLWAEEPSAEKNPACKALDEDKARDESKLTEETKKKYEQACKQGQELGAVPLKELKPDQDSETAPEAKVASDDSGGNDEAQPKAETEDQAGALPVAEPEAQARDTLSKTALQRLQEGYFPTDRRNAATHLLAACRSMTVAENSPRLVSEQACANTLATINMESAFRPFAQNPGSSAYGLGQYINGTWRAECAKYMGLSQADCAEKRDDPYTQAAVLARSTQERLDKFNAGRLDCRGLDFATCNYAIYHHSGSWGVQEYVNRGISHYNQTAGASQAVYRDAFGRLSGENPEAVMASMPMTRVQPGQYAATRGGGSGQTYTIGGGTFTNDTVGGSMTGYNPAWQAEALAPPSQNIPTFFGQQPLRTSLPTGALTPNRQGQDIRIGAFEQLTEEQQKKLAEEANKKAETEKFMERLRTTDNATRGYDALKR